MEKDVLEQFLPVITCLSGLASILIGVVGLIIAVKVFVKSKRDNLRSLLAKDAYALYYVEQQAIKRIAATEHIPAQTVQRQLRDAAEKDPDNLLSLRPKQSGKNFLQYIK